MDEKVGVTKLRGSSILVTGGAGFLGSRVVSRLEAAGARRIVVPRSASYDLRNPAAVANLFDMARQDGGFDVVIHLAANVGGIGYNLRHPGTLFYDNLMMGTLVLEESRRREVGKFVGVGTVCSYPSMTSVPFKEEDLWLGYPEETNAPYGLAKKMLLVQAQAYRSEFGLNSIFLVPVNLYGPGDNFDPVSSHVVPALIRRFHAAVTSGHERVVVWGDGSATREFLYVDDAAEAIVLAAASYEEQDPVNVGSGVEVSIRNLAHMIAGLCGYRGEIVFDSTRPNGQMRRVLDTGKAYSAFGFRASTDFESGLRITIEWYRDASMHRSQDDGS